MSDKINFIKQKSVFEFRYQGTPFFRDAQRINNITTNMGKYFLESNVSNPDIIIMSNKEDLNNMTIQTDRLSINQDYPKSIQKFINISKESVQNVNNQFKIVKYNRIGFRNIAIVKTNTIEDANSYVNSFLSIPQNIKANYGEINGAVVLKLISEHNIDIRIKFESTTINQEDFLTGRKTTFGYIVDVDISKEQSSASNYLETVEKLVQELKKIDVSFNSYFLSEDK